MLWTLAVKLRETPNVSAVPQLIELHWFLPGLLAHLAVFVSLRSVALPSPVCQFRR